MKTSSAWNLRAALALFVGISLPALATAQAPAAPATEGEEKTVKLEKFVVTGSYIPTTETALNAGVSPVVRIDRKVIDESGLSTTSELLQKITISNGGSIPISNNATGFTPAATSVSLRGLGPEATLVLINGRRVSPYPVGAGGTTAFVDLNSIPLSAVESIEVLKDGASALYGADAVAGVVNIKLRRGIDGTEVYLGYGNTTQNDSHEITASIMSGAQTDRANVLVGFNYYTKAAIMNRDRSYSEIPPFLSSNSSPINLQITPAAAAAAGVSLPANLAGAVAIFAASPAATSNNGATPASGFTYSAGRSSVFNFNEYSMSYPSRKNMGAFAFAERKVFDTDNIKVYVDLSYQNAKTENQLAPSATGNFTTPGAIELVIPARTPNPLPLPDGRARAAVAGAYNPFNPFNIDIAGGSRARLAEFGNRIFRNETDAFLTTFGIKGENIMDKWNFDAGLSYSEIQDTSRNTLVSSSRFNRLMNAADPIFNPASSEYIGSTVPYNPFGYYKTDIPTNVAVVNYAKINTKDLNTSRMISANFVLTTGELVSLPAGPVGFAIGGDVRQERLEQHPDPYGTTGDLIGSSANATTAGQRKIGGVFMEAKIPIAKGTPGAHDLSADVAVRHEKFMSSKRNATVPKIGIRWQPVDETLTLRGSWSKGFREPSLYELYSTPTAGLTAITHPLTGFREPEQSVYIAGNRRLDAEKTKYLNLGVVWSPNNDQLKGLTVSLDYWAVDRKGTVDANYQDTVDRFFGRDSTGAAAPGGMLPGESVILLPNGDLSVINSVFFNVGRTKASGWDAAVNYSWKTDNYGRFNVGVAATLLDKFERASVAGAPLEDQVGLDLTGTGDDGYLEWKGRVGFEWVFKGFSTNISGNYTDGFLDYDANGDEFMIDSTWIFDAQVSYNFRDTFAPWLSDTKMNVGVRNLFDKDPPFASGFGGNSTGYPGFLYNSENRFVYVSMSRKF